MPKGFKNMKAKAKQKATNYAAKKIYGADVIEAVAQDCLSAGFMDSLKTWMDAHQEEFSAGVGTDEGGMYPPQYMESYKLFKAYSDAQIDSFVSKHKKTVEQFMEMCAKVSDAAPQVQAFIDILTASSEFQVFVDMMTDRERRDYFFFVMKSWRLEMERGQQYQKAMAAAEPGGGAAAGGAAAAAVTPAAETAPEPAPEPAPELEPQPEPAVAPGTDSLGLPPAGEPPAPGVDAAGEPAASEGYEF